MEEKLYRKKKNNQQQDVRPLNTINNTYFMASMIIIIAKMNDNHLPG